MAFYFGCFADQADVEKEFQVTLEDNVNILVASYEMPDYEGYAYVLFERDGTLYEVNASHCSCYGLEGQWDPEDTTVESIKHRLVKGNLGGYFYNNADAVLDAVKRSTRRKVFRQAK